MKTNVSLTVYLLGVLIINNSNASSSNKRNKIRSNNHRKLSDIFDVDVDGATTATLDRYYKEPNKRTVPFASNTSSNTGTGYSKLATNNCVLNGAGVFGTSTSSNDRRIPLVFEYELEVSDEDNLESIIIPDLEQAIGKDLAAEVNVCNGRRRDLQEENEDVIVGIMQGIGLLPVDQVSANKTCTSNSITASCVYVNGQMTLYYLPSTSSNIRDGNEIYQSSLDIIQRNMNSGKYNSGAVNPNIIRVTYSTPTSSDGEGQLPISNIEANPTNPTEGTAPQAPVGRNSDSQKAYGYVIIASCAILAVVAIIFVRRKSIAHQNNQSGSSSSLSSNDNNSIQELQKEAIINDNNDQTTITTAITKDAPHLEISVTDTTDVSTMGSPSSTDDSSVSTLGVSMGCPSNESMELEQSTSDEYNTDNKDDKDNTNNNATANSASIATGSINVSNNKRSVPAPLLGGLAQDEDEKSYQDDEFLFTK